MQLPNRASQFSSQLGLGSRSQVESHCSWALRHWIVQALPSSLLTMDVSGAERSADSRSDGSPGPWAQDAAAIRNTTSRRDCIDVLLKGCDSQSARLAFGNTTDMRYPVRARVCPRYVAARGQPRRTMSQRSCELAHSPGRDRADT